MRALISLIAATVAIVGVVLRLGDGPLLSSPPEPPPSPDPRLWSFDRPVENRESLEVAWQRGRVHQDGALRLLRQDVLVASGRLAFSPCDSHLRPPLRRAIGALLVRLREAAGARLETATVDAEELDATPFLNAEVAAIIREARDGGLVYREDLPSEVGFLFPARPPGPESGRYGGRFACPDHGRTPVR
ncbi:MAG TPA: hypothetical protein VKB68_22215 [Stellaceae bacterium]|nr:hypothetical protein [Stellaceae bacterium]